MIKLYIFHRGFELSSLSPYCGRLELFLKISGLEYQANTLDATKLAKLSPKGKVPFVEVDGALMGDSALIIRYLEKTRNLHLDASVSVKNQAAGVAFERMLDEYLYWGLAYFRWAYGDPNWPARAARHFEPSFPFPKLIGSQILRSTKKKLRAQGLGLHTEDEVYQLLSDQIEAIADFLGDNDYFLGGKITRTDCIVFSTLENFLRDPSRNRLRKAVARHDNLVSYCDRIGMQYFPDFYERSTKEVVMTATD